MISYHTEDISFNLKGKRRISAWIKSVITDEKFSLSGIPGSPGDINIIFCSDSHLLSINRQYLNHDYYTDIITFDYSQNRVISGDLFVSIDTVKMNSIQYKVTFEEELDTVIIHGILHLLGYKDKSKNDKSLMKDAEDRSLEKLKLI